MEIKHAAAIGLLALFATNTSNAQNASRDLDSRVERIEKIVDKLPQISGFVNMRYQLEQNCDDATNSFDIRRARLDFRGNAAKKLSYRLQMEFAGGAKILDAYIDYAPLKELKIQAGEFKIPFSLENEYGPHQLETVENSMGISKLCNYKDKCGVNANGRDIGVMLHGGAVHRDGFDVINYAAGVFNGRGINLTDENDEKDYSARLTLKPCRHLSLSSSYYYGTYGATTNKQHRYRAAGGLKYETHKWFVRSEYLYGRTGGVVSDGVYAVSGFYLLPQQLQAIVKYDFFQDNRDLVSSRENDYTVGLNYFASKHFRLQTHYTYKARRGTLRDTNVLTVQFFAQF